MTASTNPTPRPTNGHTTVPVVVPSKRVPYEALDAVDRARLERAAARLRFAQPTHVEDEK